jgi:hypothetical protein
MKLENTNRSGLGQVISQGWGKVGQRVHPELEKVVTGAVCNLVTRRLEWVYKQESDQ